MQLANRREFLSRAAVGAAVGLPAAQLFGVSSIARANEETPVETAVLKGGDLEVHLRDNAKSPDRLLSGLDSLFNTKDAPGFDAFDPDTPPSSAGMNFEHIISGHSGAHNKFSPRRGKFPLFVARDGKSATLVRKREDDPWSMSATQKFTLAPPNAIDMDFRCVPHDKAVFGQRGYAVLFFANYMNDVADVALHFRGVEQAGGPEKWIAGDAPEGHADWNQGGTYRSAEASDLAYDDGHTFNLNTWSYDYPRFTQPFYYGRAARDMTLALMFDKMYSPEDEIRFSLFKFKVKRNLKRPAWDFQYVIKRIEPGREYGFRARLVWKRFVSPEDCQREYETWRASLV